jgi:YbbR domain-containing protein
MAGIGKRLTQHAGSKIVALIAALALWMLVPREDLTRGSSEASVIEADVEVEPAWLDSESSDFVIEEFTVVPASLRIAGPASSVSSIARLQTEGIAVSAITASNAVEVAVVLPDPNLRFVDDSMVRVEVKMRPR